MKIRHVYTVTREYEVLPEELDREVDFFNSAITSEPEEYLYSGPAGNETVTVELRTN